MGRRDVLVSIGMAMALAVAAVTPAAAAVDDFRGEADAVGVSLRILDQASLSGAVSDVVVTDASAEATGTGVDLLDSTVSTAAPDAGSERDPAEGQKCATPDLGIAGLTVGIACSSAAADVAVSAAADGALGTVEVGGSALPSLLQAFLDLVGQPAVDAVDSAIAGVDDLSGPVLDPVVSQLQAECNAALEQIPDPTDEIPDISEEGPEELAPVLETVDQVVDTLGETFPQACVVLLNLVTTPPTLGDVPGAVLDALAAALEGGTLVDLDLGTTTSSTTVTADDVTARSQAVGVGLTLPSLGYLSGAVTGAIDGLVQAFIDEVSEEVAPIDGIDVPTLDETVATVEETLDLPDVLGATDPLLQLTVADSEAQVTLVRADAGTLTSTRAGIVVVQLSEAFAALVGEENTRIEIGPGLSETILADTPLETSIAVGATETEAAEHEGLAGEIARALGVQVELATGLPGGGVGVELGTVEAAAYGAEVAAAPGPGAPETPAGGPELPATGGGLAVLGLLSLAGAWTLRRR